MKYDKVKNHQNSISFILDEKVHNIDFPENGKFPPTLTLLNYFRSLPGHKGVKEGCAEGDCGACTIVVAELDKNNRLKYKAINSCLVFLPMIHGKQLITVENLEHKRDNKTILHPVQKALIDYHGSQCGFCTPGILMSMFALYKDWQEVNRKSVEDALSGNLCRCTGYQSIIEAALYFTENEDWITENLLAIKNSKSSCLLFHNDIRYYIPSDLHEALHYKKEHPDAIVIDGATDIALYETKKTKQLKHLIDISGLQELKEFTKKGDQLSVGVAMSIEDIRLNTKHIRPALSELLDVFGSLQIRNLATIGGNLATASPIGDTLPVLMAYRTILNLKSIEHERKVALQDFILRYRVTDLDDDELIVSIEIPEIIDNSIVKSYKISKRHDLDISTVSAGFRLKLNTASEVEDIVLAFGGMAAMPARATTTESFLLNKKWQISNIEKAMEVLFNEFQPISDARAESQSRRIMAKNLLLKFFLETNTEGNNQ